MGWDLTFDLSVHEDRSALLRGLYNLRAKLLRRQEDGMVLVDHMTHHSSHK